MNVLKHRILSDEDVMQVIKPTHLCDIGNQIPHCILLASIKWVKLFGLWSVFFFFFFFFSPQNINWRGGYERPYYGLSYAIMKLRHINLKLLLSSIIFLTILIQGRNYTRGNQQIIRIPRAFACISVGAPWLWRSVMQIDKASQEPAQLRMLTAPFQGTFFSIGSS